MTCLPAGARHNTAHGFLKKYKRSSTRHRMLTWNGCKQKIPPFRGIFYKALTSFKYVASSDGGRLWFSGTGLFSNRFWIKNGFQKDLDGRFWFLGYVSVFLVFLILDNLMTQSYPSLRN
jgi:hypothetical protein